MKRITFLSLFLAFAATYCCADDEMKKESDGFTWTLRITADSVAEAIDAKGNVIIPTDRGYRKIEYCPYRKDVVSSLPSFRVSYDSEGEFLGMCNQKGEEVVPVAFKSVEGLKRKELSYYMVTTADSLYGIYDDKGHIIIVPRYYDNIPVFFNGRFEICNHTLTDLKNNTIPADRMAFELAYMPVSNPIKDYYKQQELLTKANAQQINTDDLVLEAFDLEDRGEHKDAINRLSEAIKKKPSSLAYYHRGLCYYKTRNWKNAQEDLRYVFFLDDATPDLIIKADSVLDLADAEQMGKIIRRKKRLEKAHNVINAIHYGVSQAAGSLNVGNASQNAYSNSFSQTLTNNSVAGYGGSASGNVSSGSHAAHTRRCTACGGDGKCRGTYHCHGTGVCNWCNGKGITYASDGTAIKCVNCKGSGKCPFCYGTRKCSRCKGSGTI